MISFLRLPTSSALIAESSLAPTNNQNYTYTRRLLFITLPDVPGRIPGRILNTTVSWAAHGQDGNGL